MSPSHWAVVSLAFYHMAMNIFHFGF